MEILPSISYQSCNICTAQNTAPCYCVDELQVGSKHLEEIITALVIFLIYDIVLDLQFLFALKSKPFCDISQQILNGLWSRGWIILRISPAPTSFIFCQ